MRHEMCVFIVGLVFLFLHLNLVSPFTLKLPNFTPVARESGLFSSPPTLILMVRMQPSPGDRVWNKVPFR